MSHRLTRLTGGTATDFWNDSCDLEQLREALTFGAVGATSNPVIVAAAVRSAPTRWNPVMDRLIGGHATADEEDIAWKLMVEIGNSAAELLASEFRTSGGGRGRLSLQVNPKRFRDAAAMVGQAVELSAAIPNLAVKMPVVQAGLTAMEEATAKGIVVTPTVSFSVSQAVAAAEAIERGLERAKAAGLNIRSMRPNVAIMVGRLDDHLRRIMETEGVCVDPGCLEWAGVAVFKRAYAIFKRRGFRSVLLSAAYRNPMQWSELVGGEVTVSIPYSWWKRFAASRLTAEDRMPVPVRPEMIAQLEENFTDFRRAYEPDGLKADEFLSFGPTVHTLKQFIGAWHDLLAIIRERMFR